MAEERVRINKYLSAAGICSRREADRRIEEGRVTINGIPAAAGDRVTGKDRVCVDGAEVSSAREPVLLAYYKPRGIVCTSDPAEPDNIIAHIGYPQRIYTVGRLDKDSEGLILLTNQGDLVNRITRAGNYHEKEYLVTVDRPVTDAFLKQLREGVFLEELQVRTRPCEVTRLDERRFRIVLTQGYNRQIRRMCRTLGYEVRRLIRVRVMNITLDGLGADTWRMVTEEQQRKLEALLEGSYSAPVGTDAYRKERGQTMSAADGDHKHME